MICKCTVAMNVKVPSAMDAGQVWGPPNLLGDCELHYDANRSMSERQWTAEHKKIVSGSDCSSTRLIDPAKTPYFAIGEDMRRPHILPDGGVGRFCR